MNGISPDSLQDLLASSCTAELLFSTTGRLLFSTDASVYQIVPMGVAAPHNEQDTVRVLRLCAEQGISVHPRGGGTGLAGESLGPGLILDLHRFNHSILDFDPQARRIRCQPGATLGSLNALAKPYGLKIGPDPSSGARATAGGTFGTNATGAHSLAHGYIGEAVTALRFLTAHGEMVQLDEDGGIHAPESFRNETLPALTKLARDHATTIREAYPKQHRNRSGYDLRGLAKGDAHGLIRLLAGSEGTLGIVTELTFSLVSIPKQSGIVLFGFEQVEQAGAAVPEILSLAPYSLELIGERVARMGMAHLPAVRRLLGDRPLTLLLGEWTGDSPEELNEHLQQATTLLDPDRLTLLRHAVNADDMANLWLVRKEAEALLMNEIPDKRAISFVEDICVPSDKLAELIRVKERLFTKHGLSWATYGHAGPGELHTKSYVDLSDASELSRLVDLAGELYETVWDMGGSMSGEHGDGLSRGSFLSGQYPTLTPLFEQVKRLFDPQGILNPGKKTDVPTGAHPILTHSRYLGKADGRTARKLLHYEAGEFWREASACHGCGACRVEQTGPQMCPVFKVTKDERSSPRAKGNLARLWAQGLLSPDGILDADVFTVADACIGCQACVRECPSHVNIPKLMVEFKAWRVKVGKAPLADRLLTQADGIAALASHSAPVSGMLQRMRALRNVGERISGLSAEAAMPSFERSDLAKIIKHWPTNHGTIQVLYFTDTATAKANHRLGLATTAVLNRHGVQVLPYTHRGSQMPAITTGHLDQARKAILRISRELLALSDHAPIVCTEPTAALALQKEWLNVLDTPEVRSIAARTLEAGQWLARQAEAGTLDRDVSPLKLSLAHHLPCHLASLCDDSPYLPILETIPGVSIRRIREGCCGMAGSYGMKAKHRALSEAIGHPLLTAYAEDDADGLTECSTCALRLQEGNPNRRVWHPMEVLARAYGWNQP